MTDSAGIFSILVGAGGVLFVGAKVYFAISRKIETRAKQISDQILATKRYELAKEFDEKEQKAKNKLVEIDLVLNKKRIAHHFEVESQTRSAQEDIDRQNDLLQTRIAEFQAMKVDFDNGYIAGRKWLARFITEAEKAADDKLVSNLRHKPNPALKAADEVSTAKAEKRQYKERLKYLEYQLRSYLEYFPFLEEYEEVILDEAIPLSAASAVDELEKSDPVLRYVPKVEYESLSTTERNQRALDRYLAGGLSKADIGRLYERYIGYMQEKFGWKVEYHGIFKGLEDMGRDLICAKGDEVKIIQAKCWSTNKVIHEKHIFQLFGTTQLYMMGMSGAERNKKKVSAVFVTTTVLSPIAKQAAEWLGILVKENFAMDKGYPIIKCNVNQTTKEKIYHLPFDQQYDRTQINASMGERYAITCAEAENMGFRRAMKYFGT